jgi:hypothetical protein
MDSTFKASYTNYLRKISIGLFYQCLEQSHITPYSDGKEKKKISELIKAAVTSEEKSMVTGKSPRGKLIMDYHLFTEKSSAYHLCIETNRITKDSIFGNKKNLYS